MEQGRDSLTWTASTRIWIACDWKACLNSVWVYNMGRNELLGAGKGYETRLHWLGLFYKESIIDSKYRQ